MLYYVIHKMMTYTCIYTYIHIHIHAHTYTHLHSIRSYIIIIFMQSLPSIDIHTTSWFQIYCLTALKRLNWFITYFLQMLLTLYHSDYRCIYYVFVYLYFFNITKDSVCTYTGPCGAREL